MAPTLFAAAAMASSWPVRVASPNPTRPLEEVARRNVQTVFGVTVTAMRSYWVMVSGMAAASWCFFDPSGPQERMLPTLPVFVEEEVKRWM